MKQDPHLLLHSYLKTLKLPTFTREYAAVARQCAQHNASYEAFLQQLAELEVQHRQAQAIERRIKQAGFPLVKELSDFNFAAVPKLNKKRVMDLAQCQFIEQRANLALHGAPGVGKTHLAIGLGRQACRRGYKTKFFTAASLANAYLEAREERQITRLENHIRRSDLIIVDELGYLPLDRTGAEHLFGFFSQCYETTSLMVTTNLPFADWPQIFAGDERLTGALLDRLTHHVHLVEILGDSFRLQASQKQSKQKGGDAKP
ncbi:MAG: IS21-like element helper ATPase IstB [Verrucomicrobiota bacterium]|jgi:DNA replication protein DnaC|nr:IS21-like element helper ATPase IstB [Verrucomicrobiota bacterium]MDP7292430.1 IS21-like element helper ATPase IstB [Verrucomicrobiota bacterium]|tara:strand:+ start:1659 stop:2438 length:780 start_codon:yes stop_codon:yes gene_type:complete